EAVLRKDDIPLAYVLDDDAGIRIVVARILGANGFDAQQFSDSTQFLERTESNPPELIVLDLALGQSDAVDVMRHLQKLNYLGRVLLVSGRDVATLKEIQEIGKTRGLAMLPPLRKPFRPADLIEAASAQAELHTPAPVRSGPQVVIDAAEAL